MRTYSPNGLGHMALARLSEGPATLADLREATGSTMNGRPRKAWYAVTALVEDGLAWKAQAYHGITREGRKALARLSSGARVEADTPEVVPTVRIFDAARDRDEPNKPSRRAA